MRLYVGSNFSTRSNIPMRKVNATYAEFEKNNLKRTCQSNS
nr:MAG TPA: hypothetical protein [Caudoviricetes sp.]